MVTNLFSVERVKSDEERGSMLLSSPKPASFLSQRFATPMLETVWPRRFCRFHRNRQKNWYGTAVHERSPLFFFFYRFGVFSLNLHDTSWNIIVDLILFHSWGTAIFGDLTEPVQRLNRRFTVNCKRLLLSSTERR